MIILMLFLCMLIIYLYIICIDFGGSSTSTNIGLVNIQYAGQLAWSSRTTFIEHSPFVKHYAANFIINVKKSVETDWY